MDVSEIVISGEPLSINVVMNSTEVSGNTTIGRISPVVSNLTVVLSKVALSVQDILCQVIDSEGKEIIEFKFDRAGSTEGLLTVVVMDG